MILPSSTHKRGGSACGWKNQHGVTRNFVKIAAVIVAVAAFVSLCGAQAQQEFFQFAGAPCMTPPVLHCPDSDCSVDRMINQGPIVEMKIRRTYFVEYPCDLKFGDKSTRILSIHGAGS